MAGNVVTVYAYNHRSMAQRAAAAAPVEELAGMRQKTLALLTGSLSSLAVAGGVPLAVSVTAGSSPAARARSLHRVEDEIVLRMLRAESLASQGEMGAAQQEAKGSHKVPA